MTDYERELVNKGVYALHLSPVAVYPAIPSPTKRPVSPYAKFDKYHKKKKK